MPTGKIKFYKAENGFGFITDDEDAKDIFFHITDQTHEPSEFTRDRAVSFTLDTKKNGKTKAVKIEFDQAE